MLQYSLYIADIHTSFGSLHSMCPLQYFPQKNNQISHCFNFLLPALLPSHHLREPSPVSSCYGLHLAVQPTAFILGFTGSAFGACINNTSKYVLFLDRFRKKQVESTKRGKNHITEVHSQTWNFVSLYSLLITFDTFQYGKKRVCTGAGNSYLCIINFVEN